jgi:transcriptional regulator with XRE-family HTH domain
MAINLLWRLWENAMAKIKENELIHQIRGLRFKLGLTQEQFAAEVGVTFSTVNRWENGRGIPSPLARRRIEELRCRIVEAQK